MLRWVTGLYYNSVYGVRNLIVYIPVIWRDRDWDYAYWLEFNEKKLRRMEHNMREYSYHVGHIKDADRINTVRIIFTRLLEDNYHRYWNPDLRISDAVTLHDGSQERRDREYAFKVMAKYMGGWWT